MLSANMVAILTRGRWVNAPLQVDFIQNIAHLWKVITWRANIKYLFGSHKLFGYRDSENTAMTLTSYIHKKNG